MTCSSHLTRHRCPELFCSPGCLLNASTATAAPSTQAQFYHSRPYTYAAPRGKSPSIPAHAHLPGIHTFSLPNFKVPRAYSIHSSADHHLRLRFLHLPQQANTQETAATPTGSIEAHGSPPSSQASTSPLLSTTRPANETGTSLTRSGPATDDISSVSLPTENGASGTLKGS